MTQGERITTGDDDCGDCLRLGVACGAHAPAATEDAARCLRCRDMRQLVGVPCAAHHVTDCDGEADDGRPSRVEVRAAPRVAGGSPTATAEPGGATVGEGRFAAMLRGLAPAQVLSGDLRSVDNGRDGSGGLREVTAVEKAIDRGDLAHARHASARVAAMPLAMRARFAWLTTYAKVGDLASLGALYAKHEGPLAMRGDLERAERQLAAVRVKLAQAEKELANAAPKGTRRPTPQADALRVLADGLRGTRDGAQARVEAAGAALTAWGVAALSAAVDAWEDAGEEERAA